ncbi:MAG: hypothetical protein AABY47_05500 [Pseudomonadota bacterium]
MCTESGKTSCFISTDQAAQDGFPVVIVVPAWPIIPGDRLIPMYSSSEKVIDELDFPQSLLRQALMDERECKY